MVIKSFEPGEIESPLFLFRGKNAYFWKRKIFNDVEPAALYDTQAKGPDQQPENEFHFLVIFDPQRFFVGKPGTIDEIVNYLSQYNPAEEHIFSVTGSPFFLLSYGALQTLKPDLNENNDLIRRLRKNGSVRLIPPGPPGDVEILEVSKDFPAIEKAVIDYQLATFMARGVIIEDFSHFFVEGMAPIGKGTQISPGVVIKGDSRIGQGVRLYPYVYIENSVIGDNCTLLPGSIVRDSILEESVRIGPYTHLRDGAVVKKGAKMGNFVEMKKSVLGQGSKAMHLTYIGDAEVGASVNIGAGTITCNYDGEQKHRTLIEDGVFIGSGTELVAPVTIRQNSYVGAGSTITEEVPRDALAVARQKQRNIPGWVTRKKRKKVCKI
jgi:NDP-sugar pyrophosphorylase family protein